MNAHSNEIGDIELFSNVTHVGDGLTKFRTPNGAEVAVCGWESKYLYIRDDESHLLFNPAGAPVPTPIEGAVTRFRAASTEFSGRCDGLEFTQRIFVPKAHPIEIWTVHVTNLSERRRSLSLFGYIKVGMDNALVDVAPELQGLWIHRHEPFGPDRDHRAFFCTRDDYHAATARRDCFHNYAYSAGAPRIASGNDLDNASGIVWDTIAAVQSKVTVKPGETVRVDFLLGHAESLERARDIRRELTAERIDELCAEQAQAYRKRNSAYRIDVGNPNLNGIINGFVKKQHYCYLMEKSGFRDNLQVIMALSMADYATAEKALVRALASQHEEGWPPHAFKPLINKKSSDKPTWILMVVPWMIKESGDVSLLNRSIPYLEGGEGTVWDHVLRAMRYLASHTRDNGLCDMFEGDWNDGLAPEGGDAGGRESIMVTEQFCYGLLEVVGLAKRIGDTDVEKEAIELHERFTSALNEKAWDGEWYQRAICADGFVIGSHKAEEGSFYMNSQSWAVIGQVCDADRGNAIMDQVERQCGLDIGYRVCHPPFTRYDARVGVNSRCLPGVTENGGCYNHAAGFKGVADCLLGRAEEAWNTFRKVSPDNPDNPVSHSGLEPFSYTNLFFADSYWYGKAFNPWVTGTSAWMAILIVEYILGARRDYDGLRIQPCLTRQISHAKVTRTFRGAVFHIHLDNTAGRCSGVQSITVDGDPIDGVLLPDFRQGEHTVQVVI